MNKYVAIDPKFAALKKLSEADGRDFDPRSLRKDMQEMTMLLFCFTTLIQRLLR